MSDSGRSGNYFCVNYGAQVKIKSTKFKLFFIKENINFFILVTINHPSKIFQYLT